MPIAYVRSYTLMLIRRTYFHLHLFNYLISTCTVKLHSIHLQVARRWFHVHTWRIVHRTKPKPSCRLSPAARHRRSETVFLGSVKFSFAISLAAIRAWTSAPSSPSYRHHRVIATTCSVTPCQRYPCEWDLASAWMDGISCAAQYASNIMHHLPRPAEHCHAEPSLCAGHKCATGRRTLDLHRHGRINALASRFPLIAD